MAHVFCAAQYRRDFEALHSFDARLRHLLSYATRAPSTHNSQPWKFILNGNRLGILVDASIRMPKSDALGRYRYISFGYLIHHIVLLAAYSGMKTSIRLGNDPEVVAIEFSQPNGTFDVRYAPLVDALCIRRNRRGAFDSAHAIPREALTRASEPSPLFPAIFSQPDTALAYGDPISSIASATAEGMRRAYRSDAFRREMASWIAPTGSGRKTGIPGYSLNLQAILSWVLPSLIRFFDIGGFLAKLNFASISSAPYVLGFGGEDTPVSWLGVGFQASHATLTLVAVGCDTSIYVASIEQGDTRQRASEAFGLSKSLQFLFAVGKQKGHVSWHTPRVPVAQKFTH